MSEELSEKSIDVLRDRYSFCRAEIMYRLEIRYKIVQIFLAGITFSFVALYQLKWEFFPLVSLVVLLSLCVVLLGESMHIRLLSDYMIKIERSLDKNLDYKIVGWERETRAMAGGKVVISGILAFGAAAFVLIIYSAFSWQSTEWLVKHYDRYCFPQSLSCQMQYFIALQIVLFIFMLIAIGSLISGWKKTRR